jgi:hypothetical protein
MNDGHEWDAVRRDLSRPALARAAAVSQRSAFCRRSSNQSRDIFSTASHNMVTAALIACGSSLLVSYTAE